LRVLFDYQAELAIRLDLRVLFDYQAELAIRLEV